MKIFCAAIFSLVLLVVIGAKAQPIPKGFGQMQISRGTNSINVFTYKPRNFTNGPLIVVFHGMLRNADLYVTNAAPLAERCHAIVIAPEFPTNRFSKESYNTGGVLKKNAPQPREEWTFQFIADAIAQVRARENNPQLPYYLIGHSAGGQFAMRYAALMPPGAQRIVAANPGSNLFPRRDWKFGYGFGGLPENLSDDTALKNYLAAPLTLYLGLDDNDPNHFELDKSAAAQKQGKFRLERGRNCFAYAQKLAQERGWQFNWRKVEVPGIAHDGKAMLAAKEAEDALFGGKK